MSLYDTDFVAWSEQQAAAVRAGNWDAIDRENLAEELDDLYHNGSSELWQHMDELLVWLVAWSYSPQTRQAHPWWYVRIGNIRMHIGNIMHLNPRTRPELSTYLAESYTHGREVGAEELGVPPETFPEACPWTVAQVLKGNLDGPAPFFQNAGEAKQKRISTYGAPGLDPDYTDIGTWEAAMDGDRTGDKLPPRLECFGDDAGEAESPEATP